MLPKCEMNNRQITVIIASYNRLSLTSKHKYEVGYEAFFFDWWFGFSV
jgi:hypothetical protein